MRTIKDIMYIQTVINEAEYGYTRPERAEGTPLDYGKINWEDLENQMQRAANHKVIGWVMIAWAYRLKCSKRTLYRGLRKYRRGDL